MEYCTQHRWEEVGEHEVDLEQKDLMVVTDMHGIQHSLLRGRALERQRARTPEPRKSDLKVETVAPVVLEPTLPLTPTEVEEPEPIPEIVEAIVASFDQHGRGVARITRKFRRDGFVVIRIDRKDVVTEGELYEGRLIRCRVAPPDPDGTLYNAREIEIYQDSMSDENVWHIVYVVRFDEYSWTARIEDSNKHDPISRVYVHRSVVADGFAGGVIGTKVKLRLTPNRKEGGVPWEALECIVEKDLAAQNADGENRNDNE
jgi:hypothetical protein